MRYPLEVYAVTAEGVSHYEPQEHGLTLHVQGDVRSALGESEVVNAPFILVIAAVYARTTQQYGEERGARFVHLEAGHAAQNVLLQAVALNLGAVPVGGFSALDVKQVLELPSDQEPLYLIPVGHLKASANTPTPTITPTVTNTPTVTPTFQLRPGYLPLVLRNDP
jgi:SagB-type dehydrogenase family enzyme